MTGLKGGLWFELGHICGNTRAHSILREIAEMAAKGGIAGESERILDMLATLRGDLQSSQCPRLCTLAIQTLKELAFVDGADHVNWGAFGYVSEIWNWGRQHEDAGLQAQGQHSHSVFDPAKYLDGWTTDLALVKRAACPWYVRLLGCAGLQTSPHFKGAVDALVKHVEEHLAPSAPAMADQVTCAFVKDVLEPLLDTTLDTVLGHLAATAKLFAAVAKNATSPVDLTSSATIGKMLDRIRARGHKEPFWPAFDAVNLMYRRVKPEKKRPLESSMALLVPKMLSYPSRERRRRATAFRPVAADDACRAAIKVHLDTGDKELGGEVFDLCNGGHGYHITFDDSVVDCGPVRDAEFAIEGTSVRGTAIMVKTRNGEAYQFRSAMVRLHLPQGFDSTDTEREVFCLRGFPYENEHGDRTGRYGAVFWVRQEPQEVTRYRSSLPESLGGEAEHAEGQPTREAGLTSRATLYLEGGWRRREGIEPHVPAGVAPFGEGIKGLVDGVRGILSKLAANISLHEGWRSLRDHGQPVEERHLGVDVRGFLKPLIEERGPSFTWEYATGRGPCDYLVARGTERLFIELKPSYGNWRQGITAELPTYIRTADENLARAGLFLVLAFDGAFHLDSPELNELLSLRDKACSESGAVIDVAVIDCDKPDSASKLKVPAMPGEALHYFEHRVPQRPASLGLPAAQQVLPDTLPQMPEVGSEPMPPAS